MSHSQHPCPETHCRHRAASRHGYRAAVATLLSLCLGWLLAPPPFAGAAMAEVPLGDFSTGDLTGWEEHSFAGRTSYRLEAGGEGVALHAEAAGTASVLCREVEIDLAALPVAQWRWRLDRAPIRGDERSRAGDDQGLRLSFLHREGMLPGSVIAIQYVWSQSEPADTFWPNPFSPDAVQLAAESGPARPGDWVAERRNLPADFRRIFGRDIDRVDGVCVMTDGDQTGALVEGWYGDISVMRQ